MTSDEVTRARADISARIAAIGARRDRRLSPRDVAPQLDAIRALAVRAGLHPAAAVAGMLDRALAAGERATLIRGWLPILADAVACDRGDERACEAYAAACQVRMAD